MRSMTAYVYHTSTISIGKIIVEIQSLNRKFLDVTTNLQKEIARYESDIKKIVGNYVSRGQVTVKISFICEEFSEVDVIPNISLAKQIKKSWELLSKELGVEEFAFDIKFLKGESGVLVYNNILEEKEGVKEEVLQVLEQALKELVVYKEQEGAILLRDIEERVSSLANWLDMVSASTTDSVDRYRQKLTQRIEEVISNTEGVDERIIREVCIFADRIDISEEITRFRSHIELTRALIASSKVSIGKKFEFILQEMLREANTMGSKVADIKLSHLVIDIKSELEKIREQVQNIE